MIWELAVLVINITKSVTGSIKFNDAKIISSLFKMINDHPKFHAAFFAADGTKSLNPLHDCAFKKYSTLIEKVLKNEISLDDCIQNIERNICLLPLFDILHCVKCARDKIMINKIKLGDNVEIIDKEKLCKDLNLNWIILNDKTQIGKMNDQYPLVLFRIEN